MPLYIMMCDNKDFIIVITDTRELVFRRVRLLRHLYNK